MLGATRTNVCGRYGVLYSIIIQYLQYCVYSTESVEGSYK